jgi:2-polyprenyl-3-methyl-5-hydroxy-6-metoxy-1,4-benzoquinol methylase
MPTVEQNKSNWQTYYDWTKAGDEWSDNYGSAAMQWHASIMPRINAFLPAKTILEIAPGFGRWTQYLKDQCDRLILVDLTEKCIESCKQRFSTATNIEYHVNDGRSLDMVPNGSIDFLFSYDSLVHVDYDVISSYLRGIAAKLTPDGAAFIHHSNIGVYASYFAWMDWLKPQRLPGGRRMLMRWGLVEISDGARDRSMTADIFCDLASKVDLKVVSQELTTWNSYRPIDCISIVTRPGSRWDRDYCRQVNRNFDLQADGIRKLAQLYDRSSFGQPRSS